MGRGLTILFGVILLLALAGYVMRSHAPGFSAFLLTLALLLAVLIIAAITGILPAIQL